MIATLLHLISWLPLIAAVIAVAVLLVLFRPLLKIADVIPGSIWLMAVIILVGMLVTGLLQVAAVRAERDTARQEAQAQHQRADKVQGELTQLEAAVEAQKREATAKLAALTAERDRLQEAINLGRKAQEIKDASAQATVDRYSRQLASVRLRDPFAAGCGASGGSPEGAIAAGSDNRAADASDAPGLLSERTSEDLRRLIRTADQVNIAYASCKQDSYTTRSLPAPADP